MDHFIPRRKVLEVLKVHYKTLYKMAANNQIDTVKMGTRTLYNLNKYLRDQNINANVKRKICYCRVSSAKQKNDLKRQINYMKKKYPTYEIKSDIGSGLNFKRKELLYIIDLAIKGEIDEIVITYKDRLARFGYELIEWLLTKYSNGKIIIINKTEETTPTEELTQDIVSIMNVYSAKINGLRKYKNKIKNEINENTYKLKKGSKVPVI